MMAKMKKLSGMVLGFILLTSCVSGQTISREHAISTSVAATLTFQEDQDTSDSQESSQTEDLCLHQHPGKQEIPLPAGFMAGIDNSSISFYDASGDLIGVKMTPGLSNLYPDRIHAAGGVANGISGTPLIYGSLESGGVIKGNIGDNIFQMDNVGQLVVLTGAEGVFTILGYSKAEYIGSQLQSSLKIAEMVNLPSITPQLTRTENDGYVYYPHVIHVDNEGVQGVWFSLSQYGVGGVVFAPHFGLFYYDIDSDQVTEHLSTDYWIKGFSPDQSWVIYTDYSTNPGPGLYVRDLSTCQEWLMPYYETSIYGGGYVVSSPDNQYLAWIEAGGENVDPMAPNIRLRIGKTDPDIPLLLDADLSNLSSLAGGEELTFIVPVGWLSNHMLLLQLGISGSDTQLLVGYAPDPDFPIDASLGANQSVFLAEGIFSGFIYP
jgi:hypothetical protein